MTERSGKRKPKKGLSAWSLLLILGYGLIALGLAVLLIDARHVRFYLYGPAEITVEYGDAFQDPGCYAVSNGRLFGLGERRLTVETDDGVDLTRPGDYRIEYSTRYFFFPYRTARQVHVVDTTPPELLLERREGYEPDWFSGYEEEGWRAFDLCDGDLSGQVQREELGDWIIYTVSDAAGNTASAERRPYYRRGWPEITLLGETEQTVSADFRYTDPGAAAADSFGNDLSAFIRTEGEVIPWQVGEYELRYFIENALGERSQAVRRVTVEPLRNPDVVEPEQKTIYLTFDDGPGPWTGRLLDVLANYNVKATFFVTCREPDYEDMVGRAFREGHSIGVHTASHNYYEVYASEEAYLEDFDKTEEMIRRQTGSTADIFRFPGGSSNTVSRFNRGVMTRLTRVLTDMGYQYFDWNVDSDDAGSTHTTDGVFRNVTEGVSREQYALVLQHDVKDYSVAAVERIIVWGLNNGYVFAPLDASSPTVHHDLAN